MRYVVHELIAHADEAAQVPAAVDDRRSIDRRGQRRRQIGSERRAAQQSGRSRKTKDFRTHHDFVLSSGGGAAAPHTGMNQRNRRWQETLKRDLTLLLNREF